MRQRLVVGNWKMHGYRDSVDALLSELVVAPLPDGVDAAVCPTYLHIPQALSLCSDSAVTVGDDRADCLGFAQSGAGRHRVSHMSVDRVAVIVVRVRQHDRAFRSLLSFYDRDRVARFYDAVYAEVESGTPFREAYKALAGSLAGSRGHSRGSDPEAWRQRPHTGAPGDTDLTLQRQSLKVANERIEAMRSSIAVTLPE